MENRKKLHPDIWLTFDRIKHNLRIDDRELAEYLRLSKVKFNKLKQLGGSIPLDSASYLTNHLSISIDALVTGKIDYQALAAHASGRFDYLPERYRQGAFSKKRTSINLLEFIESKFGWHQKNRILRKFQIHESVFQRPDESISIHFLTDLCDILNRNGTKDSIFFEMGAYSVVSNQNSVIAERLRKLPSVKRIYEEVIYNLISNFDFNYHYRLIHLSQNSTLLEAKENTDVLDSLKVTHIGSALVCKAKAGVVASLPMYAGLPLSEVHEVSCIHKGAAHCRFHVDFERSELLFKKKQETLGSSLVH